MRAMSDLKKIIIDGKEVEVDGAMTLIQACEQAGIEVPRGHCVALDAVGDAADALGYPVVVKFIGTGFEHKTDLGAVRVGLENRAAVSHALVEMVSSIGEIAPSLVVDQVLVEEMVQTLIRRLN